MTARLNDRRPLHERLSSWVAAGVLTEADTHIAAACAQLSGESDDDVLLAIALAIRAPRSGHVALDLARVRDQVHEALELIDESTADLAATLAWPADVAKWLDAVANSPVANTPNSPLVVDAGLVYLRRFHRHEVRVAEQLVQRASGAAKIDARLDLIASMMQLNPGQTGALTVCLSGQLGVLTGGPGTGKTRTVAALLTALLDASGAPLRAALVAPTGKAAARMGESIAESAALLASSSDETFVRAANDIMKMSPTTVHRLLGIRADRSGATYDSRRPLPYDVVIVDEASMLSLPLMDMLLDALAPTSRLILVGDAGQLASVDAGSVLGDIARVEGVVATRVAELVENRRFTEGGRLAAFADAIRCGDHAAAVQVLSDNGTKNDGEASLNRVDTASAIADVIAAHATAVVESARVGAVDPALKLLGELRVLCAHRHGPNGASTWNHRVEQHIGQAGYMSYGMYPGRPVMVTRNDRTQGLFNGDVGVIVRTDGEMRVAFSSNGEQRLVAAAQIESLETVHAMTIHKSQGSEFDHVIVVLPSADSRLATRELLYTAVTRARRSVTIVGGADVISAAIKRTERRTSALSHRLSSR